MSDFMKKIIFTIILILAFCFTAFAQTENGEVANSRVTSLVQKVILKSKVNLNAYLSEYEKNFKVTIENEKNNKTYSWDYEQYCLNNKTYCRTIWIKENGKSRSLSKIKKERERAAKDLAKNEDYVEKGYEDRKDLFGYGMNMNSIFAGPIPYLKSCRIVSSAEKTIEGRTAILLRVDDCKLDDVYSKWDKYLNFMPRTKAEILIDEKDEDVMRMDIYAKEEFASTPNQNKPIITIENMRMPEGLWLFEMIRLETIGNKLVFPNLKDNWQFDFYGYRRYEITVEESKTKSIKQN